MNSELVKNILPVIPPLITLTITLIGLLTGRTKGTTKSLDTPSLKIVSIKRSQVPEKVWKKEKIKALGFIFFINAINLIYSIYAIFFLPSFWSFESVYSSFFTGIIYTSQIILLILLYLTLFFSPFIRLSGESKRYFLFEKVEILIEGDFQYLFDKCHDVLRSMRLKVVEVDMNSMAIEAYYIPFRGDSREIKVQLMEFENSSVYQILFMYISMVDLKEKSRVTNRFINLLISKPKNTGQRTENKLEVSNDIGD